MLISYEWPGNIREFQSVIKHAILHATGPVLLPEFMPEAVRGTRSKSVSPETAAGSLAAAWEEFLQERIENGTENLYGEALHVMEKHLLTTVLRHTSGNKLQAAKILGMTRATLRNKMSSLGVNISPSVSAEGAP
jgi:two-component system nitrogen regulation response regulator GlnG